MVKIPDFDGLYCITEDGKIWSCRRNKFLKPSLDKHGYHVIHLSKKGKLFWFRVHRLVAQVFIENQYNKPEVNHKDGNKSNNSVNNLEWVTSSENKYHAFKHGLNKP